MENELRDITNLKYYSVYPDNPIIMKLETSISKNLYHYTTRLAAKGILDSDTLWVTHSSYLDDTTEIKYISIVIKGVIEYLKESKEAYNIGINGQFYVYEAIIKTLEALKEIYTSGAPISGGNLFLLSLTENKNNEYLIDNYCGSDGAVIELSNDNAIFKGDNRIFSIFSARVEYDLAKQMTLLIEDINDFYYEFLNNMLYEKIVDYMDIVETVKSVIYLKVINYSFFFKHEKFIKEEEYRKIFLVGDDFSSLIKERIISGRRKPYIEVKFNKIGITNVSFL
jgi:hypothetical protein